MKSKSFQIRPIISTLFLAFSTMMSSGAMAKIPVVAFKGTTKHFLKKHCSPIIGEAALETGLVENIRLNGPYTPADRPDGTRDYVNDTSEDPLWNVVKILFPSSGSFGINTTADTNFAGAVTSPETVAKLLTFADNIREGKIPDLELKGTKFAKDIQNLSREIKELNKKIRSAESSTEEEKNKLLKQGEELNKKQDELKIKQFIEKTTDDLLKEMTVDSKKKKDFKKKILEPLLEAIRDAIPTEQEAGMDVQNGLYPTYTTEQVINAFFCYKFEKQSDINVLIKALPKNIVDPSVSFPDKEELFTEEDIKTIAEAPQDAILDLDDLFALGIKDVFSSVTPYRTGVSPLSNGPTKPYDRKKNDFLESAKTFADCTEITARHFLNLILFDSMRREFNLDSLKKLQKDKVVGSPERSYIDRLIEFYEKQPPMMANAGDINIRSEFNRVIGDLNAFSGGPIIKYVGGGTNEFDTGVANFIHAFQKILSLDLPPVPIPTVSEEDHRSWAKEAFQTLFTTLNPAHAYELDLSQTKWDAEHKDLYGKINIKVNDISSHEELFNFSYSTTLAHSEISDLKSLTFFNDIELGKHPTKLHEGTAEDSLWLLLPSLAEEKIQEPLYALFPQALADNDAKIKFIDTLTAAPLDGFTKEVKSSLNLMVINVLKTFSWDNIEVITHLTNFLINGILKNKSIDSDLKNAICNNVQSLAFTKEFREAYLPHFPNLKSLNPGDVIEGNIAFTPANAMVEKIDFSLSNINEVTGLEHLPALKEINIMRTDDLTELTFSAANAKLERVNVAGSAIEKLEGLEHLPALKEIDASYTSNLKKLTFSAANAMLEKIDISGSSSIERLEGLKYLPALKVIEASDIFTKNLSELHLPKSLQNRVTVSHKNIIWDEED